MIVALPVPLLTPCLLGHLPDLPQLPASQLSRSYGLSRSTSLSRSRATVSPATTLTLVLPQETQVWDTE